MSATATDLHAALWELLDAVSTITAYDGLVPDEPPADVDGAVWPYWVLWAGSGAPLDRDNALDDQPVPATDWTARVTVAASTPAMVLAAAGLLRSTIAGRVLVNGATRLHETTPADLPVQRDDDVTPRRFYLPTTWRCGAA